MLANLLAALINPGAEHEKWCREHRWLLALLALAAFLSAAWLEAR